MSNTTTSIIPHQITLGTTRIPNIKNIIAVTSGKGGVGKSSIAFNLAYALNLLGYKVGILDADIYGPSLPTLVAEKNFKPEVSDAKFVPLEKFGMQIMSFGFLIEPNQPAIWRGAIVNKAIQQMLFDSKWHELDLLVIDMPPGTGDIHLSMCQKIPLTATIVVTTAQELSLSDVRKSIAMYQKFKIPCLGVINNMSVHICSSCGQKEDIFGISKINELLQTFQLNLLGELPLSRNVNEAIDLGIPITKHSQEFSLLYMKIASNFLDNLAKLPKDYSSNIGTVKIIK